MTRTTTHPFRMGATSYVVEADLVENARHLAGLIDDMQLVLFDLPDGPGNLPSPQAVHHLAAISAGEGLSYTVHLLDDLHPGPPARPADHPSMARARQVIELTAPLQPWAYVLHLDGRHVRDPAAPPAQRQAWAEAQAGALQTLARWAGDAARIAVENLEGYPPGFVDGPVAAAGVRRCVDIGHLWLDGRDPLPHLADALPRTSVVHIHGLAGRDHQSLAHMAPDVLDPVLALLVEECYTGVLTLEVFGPEDFVTSLDALQRGLQRVGR